MQTRSSTILQRQSIQEQNFKENANCFNQEVLNSILDDNEEQFYQLLAEDVNKNWILTLENYKLPSILSENPSYAALCVFFGAEKCFSSLLMFLSEDASTSIRDYLNNDNCSIANLACFSGNLNIIRKLDQIGIDMDVYDSYHLKPIHYAAISGKIDAFKYLYLKGMDFLANGGMNPLCHACLHGNVEIVKFYFEEIAPKDDDLFCESLSIFNYVNKTTILHYTCKGGSTDVLKYLLLNKKLAKKQLEIRDIGKRTPLICAIQNGNIECVKLLVDSEFKDIVCKNKYAALINAAVYEHLDILSFFIRKGFDSDLTDAEKLMIIKELLCNNQRSVVIFLIDKCFVKNFDEFKINELFLTAIDSQDVQMMKSIDEIWKVPYQTMESEYMNRAIQLNNEELVCFLLDKNCSFEKVTCYECFIGLWTPFMTFLKKKGFNFSKMKSKEGIPLIVKLIEIGELKKINRFLVEGVMLNKEIILKYKCILNVLMKKANISLLLFLFNYEPVFDNVDLYFIYLLDFYASKVPFATEKERKELFKLIDDFLSKYGANPNSGNAIRIATSNCLFDVLNLLVKYSCDFNCCSLNYSKMIALKHTPVFDFLERHGCKFEKVKQISFDIWNDFDENGIEISENENNNNNESKLQINVGNDDKYGYDYETFSFLLKYSDYDEIMDIKYGNGIVIDFALSHHIYKVIIQIYNKLGHVIFPKTISKNEYIAKIKNEKGNKELLNMIMNF